MSKELSFLGEEGVVEGRRKVPAYFQVLVC